MLTPVVMRALRPLLTNGWPPGQDNQRLVLSGEVWTTDNKTAQALEERGLAEVNYPSIALIQKLQAKLNGQFDAVCLEAPEAKVILPDENKEVTTIVAKCRRGRPKGSSKKP